MKRKSGAVVLRLCIAAGLIIVLMCFQKKTKKQVDYGNAPRKPVPAAMVGRWINTKVSNSNMSYSNGHNSSSFSQGTVFRFNVDGTGFWTFFAAASGYTGKTESRVDMDCTFEIELTGDDKATIHCYVVSGKVYQNNVFLHNLEAAKCYPAVSSTWECTLGEDERGKYFQNEALKFYMS